MVCVSEGSSCPNRQRLDGSWEVFCVTVVDVVCGIVLHTMAIGTVDVVGVGK